MSPEVSIITCSLTGKELSRTIKSVLAQDFIDYEIVIVAPGDNLEISKLQTKYEIKNPFRESKSFLVMILAG